MLIGGDFLYVFSGRAELKELTKVWGNDSYNSWLLGRDTGVIFHSDPGRMEEAK